MSAILYCHCLKAAKELLPPRLIHMERKQNRKSCNGQSDIGEILRKITFPDHTVSLKCFDFILITLVLRTLYDKDFNLKCCVECNM